MLSWQLHGTTRETPHKNISNMAAIVMDDISSDSGIFAILSCIIHFFWYNISFIDPPLGGFGEIFPSVMIFPLGLKPSQVSSLQEIFRRITLAPGP